MQKPLKWGTGTKTEIDVTSRGAAADAAKSLMSIVEKNWPSVSHDQRPWALLKIIELVETDAKYQTLRGHLTKQAFGISGDMEARALANRGTYQLKT